MTSEDPGYSAIDWTKHFGTGFYEREWPKQIRMAGRMKTVIVDKFETSRLGVLTNKIYTVARNGRITGFYKTIDRALEDVLDYLSVEATDFYVPAGSPHHAGRIHISVLSDDGNTEEYIIEEQHLAE